MKIFYFADINAFVATLKQRTATQLHPSDRLIWIRAWIAMMDRRPLPIALFAIFLETERKALDSTRGARRTALLGNTRIRWESNQTARYAINRDSVQVVMGSTCPIRNRGPICMEKRREIKRTGAWSAIDPIYASAATKRRCRTVTISSPDIRKRRERMEKSLA